VQYRLFFIFLIKFLLFYVLFSFLYKGYLNQYRNDLNGRKTDVITKNVALHTNSLLHFLDQDSKIEVNNKEGSVKMIFKERYVARVIEGCNAISIMILFAAFIFAFSAQLKQTTLYIALGVLTLYVLNIGRVAFLTYALYYYPEYQEVLHGTVFPLLIYGFVFILWGLWIMKFAGYDKKNV
jgi:exosortase family protein XrtF